MSISFFIKNLRTDENISVEKILNYFEIDIDIEEAIRERDW